MSFHLTLSLDLLVLSAWQLGPTMLLGCHTAAPPCKAWGAWGKAAPTPHPLRAVSLCAGTMEQRNFPAGTWKGLCKGVDFSSLVSDPDLSGTDVPAGCGAGHWAPLATPLGAGQTVAVLAGRRQALKSCPPPDGAG